MIKAARGRILVKLISVYDGNPNPLNLTIIDKKKHFDHSSRRGLVESVGRGVHGIVVGHIVVFRGDAGYSMDGDPEMETQLSENEYRWLKESDCLAVEETISSIDNLDAGPEPEPEPESKKILQEA